MKDQPKTDIITPGIIDSTGDIHFIKARTVSREEVPENYVQVGTDNKLLMNLGGGMTPLGNLRDKYAENLLFVRCEDTSYMDVFALKSPEGNEVPEAPSKLGKIAARLLRK